MSKERLIKSIRGWEECKCKRCREYVEELKKKLKEIPCKKKLESTDKPALPVDL